MLNIMSTVNYNMHNHSTKDFVKRYFAPMGSVMMKTELVDDIINRRSVEDALDILLSTKWHYTKMVGSMVAGQIHNIPLIDDAFLHVYMLENARKDKLVLFFCGQHNKLLTIDIGYSGSPDVFKKYLEVLTITEFEVYSGLRYLDEECA